MRLLLTMGAAPDEPPKLARAAEYRSRGGASNTMLNQLQSKLRNTGDKPGPEMDENIAVEAYHVAWSRVNFSLLSQNFMISPLGHTGRVEILRLLVCFLIMELLV